MWAHPLPGTNFVLLNEVAVNFGLRSYVEIFSQDGFLNNSINDYYFGILVLQPDVQNGKVKVVSAVDLSRLRESPQNNQFFVLGDPEESWITNNADYYGSTLLSSTAKRVYGPTSDWLTVSSRTIKMIVLTSSRDSPITSTILQNQNPTMSGGRQNVYPFLEREASLQEYLRKNQLDIIILRGQEANSASCRLIDGLFHPRYLEIGRLTPFLKVIASNSATEKKTQSRCGSSLVRYEHLSFESTDSSPGRSNVEYCPQVLRSTNQNSDTKPSHTGIEGTCNFEDYSVYEKLTGQQFINSVSQGILDEELNNELVEICGSLHDYRQNFAAVSNEVLAAAAKRRKIWHVFEDDTCPNDPFNEYKRQRKVANNLIEGCKKHCLHK